MRCAPARPAVRSSSSLQRGFSAGAAACSCAAWRRPPRRASRRCGCRAASRQRRAWSRRGDPDRPGAPRDRSPGRAAFRRGSARPARAEIRFVAGPQRLGADHLLQQLAGERRALGLHAVLFEHRSSAHAYRHQADHLFARLVRQRRAGRQLLGQVERLAREIVGALRDSERDLRIQRDAMRHVVAAIQALEGFLIPGSSRPSIIACRRSRRSAAALSTGAMIAWNGASWRGCLHRLVPSHAYPSLDPPARAPSLDYS